MSEEKRKVLEMLEQGKINVEEAHKLLEALGESGAPQEELAPAKEEEAVPAQEQGAGETARTNGEKAGVGPAVFSTPAPTLQLPDDLLAAAAEGEKAAGEPAARPRETAEGEWGGAAREQTPRYEYETCPPPAPGWQQYEYTVDAAGIEDLDLSWISGPMEVRAWGGERIRVTEYARTALPEGRQLQLQTAGGVLTVRWAREVILFGLWPLSKHLVVELPAALAAGLGRVKCANVAGKTYLTGLCAQTLEASSTSGLVSLGGVTARRLAAKSISGAVRAEDFAAQTADFGTTSGAVEAWGSAEELQLKSVSGALRLGLGQCPGKAVLGTTSGGIVLTLPGEIGFTAKFSSVSGRFSTDFQVEGEMGGKQGKVVHGDGYAKLKLNTISGGMKVLKA